MVHAELSVRQTLEPRKDCRDATREYMGSVSPTTYSLTRHAHISRRTCARHVQESRLCKASAGKYTQHANRNPKHFALGQRCSQMHPHALRNRTTNFQETIMTHVPHVTAY
jgi:hypothetical protein